MENKRKYTKKSLPISIRPRHNKNTPCINIQRAKLHSVDQENLLIEGKNINRCNGSTHPQDTSTPSRIQLFSAPNHARLANEHSDGLLDEDTTSDSAGQRPWTILMISFSISSAYLVEYAALISEGGICPMRYLMPEGGGLPC